MFVRPGLLGITMGRQKRASQGQWLRGSKNAVTQDKPPKKDKRGRERERERWRVKGTEDGCWGLLR